MNEVDQYINQFPKIVQDKLKELRQIIKNMAPLATESIAYGMPAYKMHNMPLVYFAAFKQHIGFYALPSGHAEFKIELSKYKQGKGSVQFPLSEPLPGDLIGKIVLFRVHENTLLHERKSLPKNKRKE